MTWHLKDREFERFLEKYSDGNFVKALNFAIERDWIDAANVVTVEFERKFLSRGYTNDFSFRTDELEDIPEYNPKDWNEYPKVMPVHGIYRLEVCHSLGSPIRLYAACFDFYSDKGWYEYGNGKYINTDVTDGYVRFRPWKD